MTNGKLKLIQFSFPELEANAEDLLRLKPDKTIEKLKNLSPYQLGQFTTYFLFQFCKLTPKDRQESDNGKQLFRLMNKILGLVKDWTEDRKKEYNNGRANEELIIGLRKDQEFGAIDSALGKYIKYKQEKGKDAISFLIYLLEGHDKDTPTILPIKIEKIDPLADINEKVINDFIKSFNIPVVDGELKQSKSAKIIEGFSKHFGVDKRTASDVAKALVHYYFILNENNRKLFVEWISSLEQEEKNALKNSITTVINARKYEIPTDIVSKRFNEWKQLREIPDLKISEKVLEKYPPRIRETTAQEFAEYFEKSPTGLGIEDLLFRLEYLNERQNILKTDITIQKDVEKSQKQLNEVNEEISYLDSWLNKFKLIDQKKLDKVERVRKGITDLRMELVKTGELYLNFIGPENLRFIEGLDGLRSNNKELYNIIAKYLKNIDNRTQKVFEGLDITADDFIKKATKEIIDKVSEKEVKGGQAIWGNEWHQTARPTLEKSAKELNKVVAYNRIATIDEPIIAAAFYKYVEAVKKAGVESLEAKITDVEVVLRLYHLHPLLALKYFTAAKHLTEVCEGNPEAFRKALFGILINVDRIVNPFFVTTLTDVAQLNAREAVNKLEAAFDDLMLIKRSALAQYTYYNLFDENIFINQYPPHVIEQKPPAWKPQLLAPEVRGVGFIPPYPFPRIINTTPYFTPFLAGGVVTTYPYGGIVTLPRFPFNIVESGAKAVGAALDRFVSQVHFVVIPPDYLPKVHISRLSDTRLLNEINMAFIYKKPSEYSGEIIGGGIAAGFVGKKIMEDWQLIGGGLGSLITPTGGAAVGGAKTGISTFAGFSAVAIPIGWLKKLSGKDGEIGIESAVGGYEEYNDKTKEFIVQALGKIWDPSNPKQTFFAVSGQVDAEEKSWNRAKYLYIDKEGTIYELKGGTSDFVNMHNYLASYADRQFGGNWIYTLNIEPTIARGGGAVAFDAGKNAFLIQGQAVPLFIQQIQAEVNTTELKKIENNIIDINTNIKTQNEAINKAQKIIDDPYANQKAKEEAKKDKEKAEIEIEKLNNDIEKKDKEKQTILQNQPPLLLNWTIAGAHTEEVTKDKTKIYTWSLPGKFLRIGPTDDERKYLVQDLVLSIRTIEGENAYEWNFGIGGAKVPESGTAWRGGIFYKSQKVDKSTLGFGAYYEASATNLEAIAMFNESQETIKYIQSLHRIGGTLYGSGSLNSRMVIGGLLHYVEQFKYQEREGFDDDTGFWRLIGFMKALQSEFKIRVDVTRRSGLDEILTAYDNLSRDVQKDPIKAVGLINNFKSEYELKLKRIYDHYYLGIQLNKDWSLELDLVMREPPDKGWKGWTEQNIETAAGRTLVTWRTGYWTAYALVPVHEFTTQTMPGEQTVGIIGSGFGTEAFDGTFFQRFAVHGGVLLGLKSAGSREGMEIERVGGYTQAAALLYSNVLSDSNKYKKLVQKYNDYQEAVKLEDFGKIPKEVREIMCREIRSVRFEIFEEMEELLRSITKLDDYNKISKETQNKINDLLTKIENAETIESKLLADINNDTTIPQKERNAIDNLLKKIKDAEIISSQILLKIEDGEKISVITDSQKTALAEGLYNWFYNEKAKIQTSFDGNIRAYIAGSSYFFTTDKIYWDVGAYVEIVEQAKAYVITAGRERTSIYSGIDVTITPTLIASGVGGITLTGPTQVSGGVSLKYKLPFSELSLTGFGRSSSPIAYSHPAYLPYKFSGYPEFGVSLFVTIGGGVAEQPPTQMFRPNYRGYGY